MAARAHGAAAMGPSAGDGRPGQGAESGLADLSIDAAKLAVAQLDALRDAGADLHAACRAALQLVQALLSDGCTASLQSVYAAGGLDAVLRALRAHPSQLVIVFACVHVLAELTGLGAAAAQEAFDAGAADAAAAALATHPADAGVTRDAVKALLHMVASSGASDPRAVQRFAPAVAATLVALRAGGVVANEHSAQVALSLVTRLMRVSPRFTDEFCEGDVVGATLGVLKAHAASDAVQAEGLMLFEGMLHQKPDARAETEHNGVLAAMFAALQGHAATSSLITDAACLALNMLPRAGAEHAARLGGVEALCGAPQTHYAHAEASVYSQACLVLLKWCEPQAGGDDSAPEENRRRALKAGAAKWLVAVLPVLRAAANAQKTQRAADAHIIALSALSYLTARPRSEALVSAAVAACTSAGMVEAAVSTLAAHPGNAAVEWRCAELLLGVCCTVPALRLRAVQAGALPLLVCAARAKATLDDQRRCTLASLAAIGNLVSGNDDSKRLAVAAGAIEATVAVLRANVSDVAITNGACLPLINLTAELSQHQARAVAAGVLPVLVAALRTHTSSSPDVSTKVATALSNTLGGGGSNAAHARAAVAAGAIPALLAAMRAQPAHAELQAMCAVALGNICAEIPENQTAVCNAGALQLLVAALNAHPGATKTQRNVAVAIGNLVAGQLSLVKQAGSLGVVEAVVAALRRIGTSSAAGADDTFFALGHIAGVPANTARAVAAGAFAAIVAAQRAAPAVPAVAKTAWTSRGSFSTLARRRTRRLLPPPGCCRRSWRASARTCRTRAVTRRCTKRARLCSPCSVAVAAPPWRRVRCAPACWGCGTRTVHRGWRACSAPRRRARCRRPRARTTARHVATPAARAAPSCARRARCAACPGAARGGATAATARSCCAAPAAARSHTAGRRTSATTGRATRRSAAC